MEKILVISTIPSPPVRAGNSKCILEYCKMLREADYDVHYLYIEGKTKLIGREKQEFSSYWGDNLHIYERNLLLESMPRLWALLRARVIGYNHVDDLYPLGLTSYVGKLHAKEHFKAVVINYVTLSKLFASKESFQKILYTHDVFSYKKQRLGVDKFWFDLTPNDEAKGVSRADVLLSIQDNESIYYRYIAPSKKTYTAYTSFSRHVQKLTGNNNILFLAGKNELNLNGIRWFIKKVFPLVLAKVSDAQLCIGGSICKALDDIVNPNISLLGKIEDEERFYSKGDIAINPIYQGTGLKIKTFEALSFGKVTVVHPHSMEGIYESDKAPLLVGDTPERIADHLVTVLENKLLRKKLSDAAYNYIGGLNEYVKQRFIKAIENK